MEMGLLRYNNQCKYLYQRNVWRQERSFSNQTRKEHTTKDEMNASSFLDRSLKLPAVLGFSLIAFLQYYRLTHPSDDERKYLPAEAIKRLPGELTEFEKKMVTQRQLESLRLFPYRAASRLWGSMNAKELPLWLRKPIYQAWTAAYGCNLEEMAYPLKEYKNLGEFFCRPLKPGARPIDSNPNHLLSPVDGKVAAIGLVQDQTIPTLEQIKGARYRLDEFLGDVPAYFTSPKHKETQFYHCVVYLAPGDYHRIHAPVDCTISQRRHFPGTLFPVNSMAARNIPSLFIENERVALIGEWELNEAPYYFALVAVGATNVGSIGLTFEPEFMTNIKQQDEEVGNCLKQDYTAPINIGRGDEVAQFKLGSTVVLVFEAPKDFEFNVKVGQKVKVGQAIGKLEE